MNANKSIIFYPPYSTKMPTQQQQIKDLIKQTYNQFPDMSQKWIPLWDWETFIKYFLQQLQAEHKQEVDIDKIINDIMKDIDCQWSDFSISSLDVILDRRLTKHLTQKTTVPKDGEVVEIKWWTSIHWDGSKEWWMCPKCWTDVMSLHKYCRICWAKIKRID